MSKRRVHRTPAAAEYLGISESWLEKLRLSGLGPRFIRLGRRAVVYDERDLDRWLDGHRERPRPTQTGPASPDAA